MLDLGKNLREARKKVGFSQKRLAEICQLSQTIINHYESGKKYPTVHNFLKISLFLDVSPSYLIGNELNSNEFNNLRVMYNDSMKEIVNNLSVTVE